MGMLDTPCATAARDTRLRNMRIEKVGNGWMVIQNNMDEPRVFTDGAAMTAYVTKTWAEGQ